MAKQTILNGTFDNDPSAEKIRLAFNKVNANFTEIYDAIPLTSTELAAQAGKILVVNGGGTAFVFASAPGGGDLLAANNLSELVATAATARTNLGLGTAATTAATSYATAAQGALAASAVQTISAGAGISIGVVGTTVTVTNTETDTEITGFTITADLVLRITLSTAVVIDVDLTSYLVPSIGGMFLEKYSGNKNFAAIQANDVLKGWEDFDTKEIWLEGTVLALPFTLPADLRDAAKFFITNEKVKI